MARAHATVAAVALLACVAAAAAAAATNKLPSAFKYCKKSEPDFDPCLAGAITSAIKTIASGSSELGTPPLDPLEIPKVVIPGRKDAPVNINLEFSNIVASGIKDMEVDHVKADVDHYQISFKGVVKKLTLDSDYVMDGRILLIPANGKGRLHFDVDDLSASVNLTGEERVKNNVSYMKVTGFSFKFDKLGHLGVKFENLFNGDKTLGESLNTLLNENSQELWAELRGPFEQVLEPTFREYAKRCFDRAPYNEIFLP